MKKIFCDVCKAETKNERNLEVRQLLNMEPEKFDLCSTCRDHRTIGYILANLIDVSQPLANSIRQGSVHVSMYGVKRESVYVNPNPIIKE